MNHKKFFEKLPKYFDAGQRIKIEQAYWLSKSAHRLQRRDGGERYFNHCRRVAISTIEYLRADNPFNQISSDVVVIALLHDAVEDCWLPMGLIRNQFGSYVDGRIHRLSKLVPVYDEATGRIIKKNRQPTELYLKGIRYAGLRTPCFIKMADRLDNLRTMNAVWTKTRQQKYLKETMLILEVFKDYDFCEIHKDLVREVSKANKRLA